MTTEAEIEASFNDDVIPKFGEKKSFYLMLFISGCSLVCLSLVGESDKCPCSHHCWRAREGKGPVSRW